MSEPNFIRDSIKLIKWICLTFAIIVSLGTSLLGIMSRSFDPFFSWVVVPIFFSIAALIGISWTKWVIAPIRARVHHKSGK